jgi:hypothetical protein
MTCLLCGCAVAASSAWVGHLCLCCDVQLVACPSCVAKLPASWAAQSALDTRHARSCAPREAAC